MITLWFGDLELGFTTSYTWQARTEPGQPNPGADFWLPTPPAGWKALGTL